MPSSRWKVACTGQTGTQGGLSQWLHRRGSMTMAHGPPASGVTSYCSTVVRNCPIGGTFSSEQLTVQDWQPMHLRMSTTIP
ncbi:hypothetical protein D3C72_1729200 [compost metagenome]